MMNPGKNNNNNNNGIDNNNNDKLIIMMITIQIKFISKNFIDCFMFVCY